MTEDRRQSGLVINKSIEDNIILPSLNLLRGLFLKVSSVREIALELMQKLGIKAPNSQSETKIFLVEISKKSLLLNGSIQKPMFFCSMNRRVELT